MPGAAKSRSGNTKLSDANHSESLSSADELDYATDVFRRAFSHSSGGIPFYPGSGRALLPPTWNRPALVVPLDGNYVVEDPPKNRPVPWLIDGFSRQLPKFLRYLDIVKPALDFSCLPKHDTDGVTPYLPNGFFGPMDAASLTGMIGLLKPHRYVEVGSGISTRFARRAVGLNNSETKITCIDPSPRSSISGIADEIIQCNLLDVDLTIFKSLGKGDILFFDGSHLSFSGSDCPTFFLEVLPSIAPGVYIHIHDIFLPDDYPSRIRTRFYNEQQLLAAFLFDNFKFDVILPVNYLHKLGYCPEGVSFWMRRVVDWPVTRDAQ